MPSTTASSSSSAAASAILRRKGNADCIIIGSGLAGLTTALKCLDRGGHVILLEKESKLGGNSIKASSGINACPMDSDGKVTKEDEELFIQDTLTSAGKGANPMLVKTLVENSSSALRWLKDRVGVDLLSNRTRLGGHSQARTYRPSKGAVGYSVISGMQKALKPFEDSGKLEIKKETSLMSLITATAQSNDHNDELVLTGVTAKTQKKGGEGGNDDENNDDRISFMAPNIVLATGGFAANRGLDSLLAKFRPDLLQMPATFGDFSTGDGIQVALEATNRSADTCLMDKVQIHPTGFIDPADPTSPSKFLCAELLRGIGGILLNSKGERFCNELGTRDYVVDQMMMQQQPTQTDDDAMAFYIVLGSEAAKQGSEHVGFYKFKKLLQPCDGIEGLAKYLDDSKVSVESLTATLREYEGDAKTGKDRYGKTFFPNVVSVDDETNLHREEFLVGKVTPVLHYCMGGLTINSHGQVLVNGDIDDDALFDEQKQPSQQKTIQGLYAVGEVAGGVHGDNRLAGNSLLECLVFGSIIGSTIPLQQEEETSPVDKTTKIEEDDSKHTSKISTKVKSTCA